MEIMCEFKYNPYEDGRIFYTSFIKNQQITEDVVELKFKGIHDYGHSNNDVIDVIFVKCDITKVPTSLTKVFPNMKDLSVWHSNLQKVTANDLAEYKNLERFGFCDDHIEFLAGDLFVGFKYLNEVVFCGNNLKNVEPNILDGLDKLKIVNFSGNANYLKHFSNIPGYTGNATLEEVKNELYQQFYSNPKNIEHYKRLIANLTQENQEMKLENSKLKLEILKMASIIKSNSHN